MVNEMTDRPVFTEPFYIDKFMEIQQQNIVLYMALKKIEENPTTKEVVLKELGENAFDALISAPA
jgi:hypothetical protein